MNCHVCRQAGKKDPKCWNHGDKIQSFIVGCALNRKLAILGKNKLTGKQVKRTHSVV